MIVQKITSGFVIQQFDTELNCFVSQEFVAGDDCDYEDEEGEAVDCEDVMPSPEPYLSFDMVQPEENE